MKLISEKLIDLDECTEFRQELRTRTPAIVHGTAALLIILLISGVTWMALTEANLVVVGRGRIRAVSEVGRRSNAPSPEISAEVGGRVIAVFVKAGDEVRSGDVLLRLDTTRWDLRIAKLDQSIHAAEEALTHLEGAERAWAERYDSARRKAQAELDDTIAEIEATQARQTVDVELAEITVMSARDRAARFRNLAAEGVTSEQELADATRRLLEAEAMLRRARVPLSRTKITVLERALDLMCREYRVEQLDGGVRRQILRSQVEAAICDLARIRHERAQSVIVAPAAGVITRADIRAGDIIEPGRLGITTAPVSGFEFEMQVAAADVAHLRPSMSARIKLDAYDYQNDGAVTGTVEFVAPDSTLTGTADGLKTAVYTVRVRLDESQLRGDHRGRIKLGMTGTGELVTETQNILRIMARFVNRKISFG